VDKGVAGMDLNQTHLPGIEVGQDGSRAVFGADLLDPGRHPVQGLIPGDGLKPALPLGAAAQQRRENPLFVMDMLGQNMSIKKKLKLTFR
jgi:hypothetical protein